MPAQPALSIRNALQMVLVVVLVAFLATCGGDDTTTLPNDNGNTGTVGSAGGTVTDPGGASVVIPAGALSAETAITVKTYADADACPHDTGPVPEFVGGGAFGPDGTQFAVPVTVTIPANEDMTPGTQFPLFVYDDTEGGWRQTDFMATVAADERSFSAEVTHFSTIGGFGGLGDEGMFNNIDVDLCNGGDPNTVVDDFITWFKQNVADVGNKGIFSQQCKELCGIDFDVHVEIEGNNADVFKQEGDESNESVLFVYTGDCTTGPSAGGYIDASVTVYFRCGVPALTASADPDEIEKGESSTVTAVLTCGTSGYGGETVEFECIGPGDVSPSSAATNAAGQAQATYTNDGGVGDVTVACDHDGCAGTQNADAAIKVSGDWTGTLTVDFNHTLPSPPLLGFDDSMIITFSFSIEEGVISGTGLGTHNVSLTPGGDCWDNGYSAPSWPFVVEGTATEQTLAFQVVPTGQSMTVSFTITCGPDDPEDFPYPGYGWMESAIIASEIQISCAREDGATDSGSGVDPFAEDDPMDYSYTVTVRQ